MKIDILNLGMLILGIITSWATFVAQLGNRFRNFEDTIFRRADEKYISKDDFNNLFVEVEVIKNDIKQVLNKIDHLQRKD